ncbi:hypothetical protein GH714_035865 [Hevea brasiliensis]|uniref:Exoribonuclease phosphorolytic domain-containing protein n=1 Tax=Hevea brasiliensis TaxID=3981 RepID=A0A6A6KUY5_HEVBR|nr:hypothetical protein GH714_035865 [Hevea brasiliensis]
MDARLTNAWRMTVNEKKFIETALASDMRVDGRNPLEEDGSSEVQLGQTHVMGFVTSQLVQPYRDRPNEGSLSIFTEFSPMADPSFEPGRPGESAVELGRIIDRGLRNLVDAANIAALAALLTFQRPECTLGGEDGQQVIVHPPEVKEPLPLIVHHLPIAVTFAFFNSEHTMWKAGGEGVTQSDIMRCLRLASRNAESITKKIKDAVEAYSTERALRKIKRHSTSVAVNVSLSGGDVREHENKSFMHRGNSELSRDQTERLKLVSEESCKSQSNDIDGGLRSSEQGGTSCREGNATNFLGGRSRWDPYSKGVDSDSLKASLASCGISTPNKHKGAEQKSTQFEEDKIPDDTEPATSAADAGPQMSGEKTLKDTVKPKNKRRKKTSSSMNAS